MARTPELSRAETAFAELADVLANEGFAGWDPYDALASPFLRAVARGRLARGAAVQALKRSPVNVRRLLAVPRLRHTKGLALIAAANAAAAARGDGRAAERALDAAAGLADRAIEAGEGLGWGYDFDVQTRWGFYRRGEPNAVVTTFAAHALLDCHPLAPGRGYDELATGAVRYARQLIVEDGGSRFFGYYTGSRVAIHNASMLLAGLHARAAHDEDLAAAADAVAYTVERQRPDGSWPYGEGAGLEWVDGFHTAYVLDALALWHARTADEAAESALRRGLDLYLARLIDTDGAARATLESRYPVDAHACASAIATLARLAPSDERALPTARLVATWTLDHLRRADGRFAFQLHARYRNSVPYVRWSDGHMLLALSQLIAAGESDAGG